MYKLTGILILAIITGNINGSQGGPVKSPEDLETHCKGKAFTMLGTVLDNLVANQDCDERDELESLPEAIANATVSVGCENLTVPKDFTESARWMENAITHLESQLADLMVLLKLRMTYEKVNSRYFYFGHDVSKNWTEAESFCAEKGGHLATFQDEKELIAVTAKLNPDTRYWTAVNDIAKKGEFKYLDTGLPVSYLKWSPGEPDDWNEEMHCVVLFHGSMRVNQCYHERRVICQADNEI
ncbi:accessory gland protein Acp29AB-like [Drosophila takahashii]|uniref:accessory gland protein Acp29AB-like n=1 Tax=Drosophila takahashii TaxID=29030 RepID=UPI001CF8D9F8|nr:C-type lectin domain family 4 member F-like [Drosophila takahashii]